MPTTVDTLKFVEKLESGGFTHQQAKAAAEAFSEATSQELATKADLVSVKTEMQLLEQRMTIKLGGLIIAATGILLAGFRYLPPGR